MKSLDDIKPRSNDIKWRDSILGPDMPKDNVWYTYRVVGGVLSYGQHWVKSTNKTGKEIVFPVDCLAWNPDREEINPSKVHECPGCQAAIKPSIKYLFNVIDRGVQKMGSSSYVRAFDLPPTAMTKITGLKTLNMVNGEPKSVANVEYGCDLHIQWSTNAGKSGKGDWVIQKGDRTPLTEEEKSAELYDFEEIYVPGDATNARASLVRAGYFREEENTIKQVAMPAAGAQLPPSSVPQVQAATPQQVLQQSITTPKAVAQTLQHMEQPVVTSAVAQTLPVLQQTVTGNLGRPPEAMGMTEKPTCFGAFKGDLDCPRCPHRPACLVLTQEREDN
jgi:hypothetical protein